VAELKTRFSTGGGGGGGGKEATPGTGVKTTAAKTKAIIELPQEVNKSILGCRENSINGIYTYLLGNILP
jgi:hypothetical protein